MLRYHLRRNGGETTVSIDSILAELLALKLGRQPDAEDAHQAVRRSMPAICGVAAPRATMTR
jgi:hypothetical protein